MKSKIILNIVDGCRTVKEMYSTSHRFVSVKVNSAREKKKQSARNKSMATKMKAQQRLNIIKFRMLIQQTQKRKYRNEFSCCSCFFLKPLAIPFEMAKLFGPTEPHNGNTISIATEIVKRLNTIRHRQVHHVSLRARAHTATRRNHRLTCSAISSGYNQKCIVYISRRRCIFLCAWFAVRCAGHR